MSDGFEIFDNDCKNIKKRWVDYSIESWFILLILISILCLIVVLSLLMSKKLWSSKYRA